MHNDVRLDATDAARVAAAREVLTRLDESSDAYGTAFAADWDEAWKSARDSADELFDKSTLDRLGAASRVRAQLVIAGQADAYRQFSHRDRLAVVTAAVTSAEWERDGRLCIDLTGSLERAWDPLFVVNDSGMVLSLPDAPGIFVPDPDVTAEIPATQVEVLLRSRVSAEVVSLPVTFTPPAASATSVSFTATTRLDAGEAINTAGFWDFFVRMNTCGWIREAPLAGVLPTMTAIAGSPELPGFVTPFPRKIPGHCGVEVGALPSSWRLSPVDASVNRTGTHLMLTLDVLLVGKREVSSYGQKIVLDPHPAQTGEVELPASLRLGAGQIGVLAAAVACAKLERPSVHALLLAPDQPDGGAAHAASTTSTPMPLGLDLVLHEDGRTMLCHSPRISIVTDGNPAMVSSLEIQTLPRELFEVVWVEEASPLGYQVGLEHARGEYVLFAPSEGRLAPFALEALLVYGYEHSAEVVIARPDGRLIGEFADLFEVDQPTAHPSAARSWSRCRATLSYALVKRSLVKQADLSAILADATSVAVLAETLCFEDTQFSFVIDDLEGDDDPEDDEPNTGRGSAPSITIDATLISTGSTGSPAPATSGSEDRTASGRSADRETDSPGEDRRVDGTNDTDVMSTSAPADAVSPTTISATVESALFAWEPNGTLHISAAVELAAAEPRRFAVSAVFVDVVTGAEHSTPAEAQVEHDRRHRSDHRSDRRSDQHRDRVIFEVDAAVCVPDIAAGEALAASSWQLFFRVGTPEWNLDVPVRASHDQLPPGDELPSTAGGRLPDQQYPVALVIAANGAASLARIPTLIPAKKRKRRFGWLSRLFRSGS